MAQVFYLKKSVSEKGIDYLIPLTSIVKVEISPIEAEDRNGSYVGKIYLINGDIVSTKPLPKGKVFWLFAPLLTQ
jgi:hypothetical protein